MQESLAHRLGTKVLISIGVALLIALALLGYLLSIRTSPAVLFNNSLRAFQQNDLKGAMRALDAALSADPNNVAALVAKAIALAQEGSLTFKEKEFGEQAIAVAEQALAIDPGNSEAYRIIGYANEIMQKYDAAHAAYAQALSINPENAAALSQDAHAWDLQGDAAKAEAGYRSALAMDPSIDQAHMGLARILVGQGKNADALDQYATVLERTSNVRVRAEAAYSAGALQQAAGDTASAERSMRIATVADPSYPLGWSGLGGVLFSQSMSSASLTLAQRNALITESIDDLQKAVLINPNQSQALLQLGTELGALKQNDAAVQILNKAKAAVANDITLSASDKAAMRAHVDAALEVIIAQAK